jgi:hypothetical protein
MAQHRAVAFPRDTTGATTYPPLALTLGVGEQVHAGREAELPIGIDPEDPGISRLALSITAGEAGWELRLTNRNGGVLHRWGQAPAMLEAERSVHVRWPRVGVRLVGRAAGVEHWILLEADDYALPVPGATAPEDSGATSIATPPRPLTGAQEDALRAVFADHLVWPPLTNPAPMARETAGRRLGISYAGVVDRLKGAQHKAHQLGSTQQFGLMEPDYLYVLVARGYLPAPDTEVAAEALN